MMIIEYNQKVPIIGKRVFIAPTAVLIGDVTIGDGASIWFNAVLRGDMAPIVVGTNSNVQDNCTIHTDAGMPATIGNNVTIGHNAVIHGCKIDQGALIGIGAIVLNGAHVKAQSVVAAGAIVREGAHVGPRQLVAGAPAVVKGELSDTMLERVSHAPDDYLKLADRYLRQRI
jgi:carbonic anhydrase/acetyltransferase-like protein (isoleucine patch superfamily)